MTLFDEPITLESLLARIEALEARVMDKPVRQSAEVPPELREAWGLWTLHKAGSKGWTAAAKRLQIKHLAELSGLNSEPAVQIVEQSIERGWTTFYLPKEQPKLTVVKTVKQALQPTETGLERKLACIHHDYRFGLLTEQQRDQRIREATEQHRGRV